MRSTSFRSTFGLACAAMCVVAFSAWTPMHFQLSKSNPEADTTVSSIESIDLWFTQVPQDKSTSIRLIGSDDQPIETEDVVQNPEDGKHQSVALKGPLAPGGYTVAWRAMAADGHVVRDTFTFTVSAEADR